MTVKSPSSKEVGGFFDEAVESFNDAVKAGVKVQEEIGKWWSDALEQRNPTDEWQRRSKAMLGQAIPAVQKNAEEWLKLIDQNYKRSLTLLKKAWETEPADAASARARTQQIWESTLDLVRDNAQAIAQANVKMMEVWSGMLRQNAAGNGKEVK